MYKKKKERKEEEGKKNVQISVWNARTHARGRKFFNIPAHPVSLVLARGIRLRRFVSKKKKKKKKEKKKNRVRVSGRY